MNEKTKAIFYITLSAFCFALMSTFVKLAGNLPSVEKSFFRNLISCIVALVIIKKSHAPIFGKKENRLPLILRATFGTIGIVANFYAIDHLVLSDASMLNKLSPFFVIIFSYFFLKENLKSVQVMALVVAFLGALFIIKPEFNSDLLPSLIGMFSATCAGAAYTCVRYLGGREKGETIVFFFSLFSIIATLPFVLLNFVPFTLNQFLFLLGAGISASIAQFSLTAAYKHAPAREISIYDYSQVIFVAIISIIIWHQTPDLLSVLGYAVILTASAMIFLYNKKVCRA